MSEPEPRSGTWRRVLSSRDLVRATLTGLILAVVLALFGRRDSGDGAALPVALFVASFGGWVALSVVRSWLRGTSRPPHRTAPLFAVERVKAPTQRPASLVSLEGLVLTSRESAPAGDRRLRPRLAAVADHRLGRHGVQLGGDRQALEAALGAKAAAVFDSSGALPFDDLEVVLDALERL